MQLQTDQQGLLDLRGMRAEYRQGRALPMRADRVTTLTRPVVVELLDDIEASDYSQHGAKLVTLYRGSWVDTGQRVDVRCVSEALATQGTRFIVEPVGRLGLCFDLCACSTPLPITLGRAVKLVGAIEPEIGLEDTAWGERGNVNDTTWFSTWRSLYCNVDFTQPPTIEGTPDLWIRNMHPVRWELGAFDATAYADGTNALAVGGTVNEVMTEKSLNDFGMCATTVPADAHCAPMQLNRIEITPPVAESGFTRAGSRITHYRIWCNEQDLTGVVPVDWRMQTLLQGSNTTRYAALQDIVLPQLVTTAGHSLWIDLWIQFRATSGIVGSSNTSVGMVTETRRLTNGPNNLRRVGFLSRLHGADAHKRRRAGDKYRLTFDAAGPGGVTELVLEPQAGWTTLDVGAGGVMMRHDATEDYVLFNFGVEVPELIVSIQARESVPDIYWSARMRYMPIPTGDYESFYFQVQSVPNQYSYGVWDCQGSTLFARQGRQRNYTNDWFTYLKVPNATAYWTGFPTLVTVEKV